MAVYVADPAPSQRVDVAPELNTGTFTEGEMVTVCVADVGPLQPVAVTVMVEVPAHVAL